MTGPEVLEVGRDAVQTMLLVCGPIMAVGMVVGLVIAFFQAITQLQEMTLTFVPKILAIFTMLLFSLPYMGRILSAFMGRISEHIISGG
ncbi:flagellar biosynthesis protein FliQ [Kordiimonas marina]|uniref:flagellar biosynthesis protein FliQ n=1 Tax=Kordiimonas marina TaxID=2872312 RepID=UPI001FF54551|nr:flagellar biosynthesis protein FliQ [Kordiimonas marina]MCJ9429023.1 flagellar biosynthesis protein FliQ [Kordiimonas marina]